MNPTTHTGMNLRDAVTAARGFDCEVRHARRTGELVVSTPDGERTRLNCRRKDAPRRLTTILNRLAREQNDAAPEPEDVQQVTATAVGTATTPPAVEPEPTPVATVTEPTPVVAEPVTTTTTTTSVTSEPPITGNTPLEHLRGFREWRDLIAGEAKAQLAKLESDRLDLARMLADADAQIVEIRAELQALGLPGATTATTPATKAVTTTRATSEDNRPLGVRAYEYLAARPGVWLASAEIKLRLGTDRQMSVALRRFLADGSIESRGQNRSTQYRVPFAK